MNPALVNLTVENRKLRAEIAKIRSEKAQAVNAAVLEVSCARSELELKQNKFKVTCKNLRDSIAGFKVEQAKLRVQIREAKPEVLQGDIEELKKDVEWTQEMLSAKVEENNGLYREQRELHQEIKIINRENKSLKNDMMADLLTIGKLDTEYKRVARVNGNLHISMNERDAELVALKDEIKKIHMTKTAEALHFECANLRLERDSLKEALTNANKRAEILKGDIQGYTRQYQTSQSQLRAESAELRVALANRDDRVEELREVLLAATERQSYKAIVKLEDAVSAQKAFTKEAEARAVEGSERVEKVVSEARKSGYTQGIEAASKLWQADHDNAHKHCVLWLAKLQDANGEIKSLKEV